MQFLKYVAIIVVSFKHHLTGYIHGLQLFKQVYRLNINTVEILNQSDCSKQLSLHEIFEDIAIIIAACMCIFTLVGIIYYIYVTGFEITGLIHTSSYCGVYLLLCIKAIQLTSVSFIE